MMVNNGLILVLGGTGHYGRHVVKALIKNGTISGGMLPKIHASEKAVKGKVNKTHIIDGRISHSLLLEIFTESGIGTEIVH